jgi:hypothetical protein
MLRRIVADRTLESPRAGIAEPRDEVLRLVCAALMLAMLALAIRIAVIW